MSNKNASNGAGCTKHAQQPPQQKTEGKGMELIEDDNEVTSLPLDDVEDPEISVIDVPSALPAVETSSLRKQIKQTMKTQKPLVLKPETWDNVGLLELSKEEFDDVISPVLNKEERRKLSESENVVVDVYDEQLTTKYLMFVRYVIPPDLYALSGGWPTFRKKLGLKAKEDTLTVWAFRHYRTRGLSFFIKVSRATEAETLKTEGPSDVL